MDRKEPHRSVTRAAAFAFATAALLGGCATGGPPTEPAPPPPRIALGPVIPLLDVPPTTDVVRAVAAPDGRVHVLVASNGPRAVREIVVAASGEVLHRRTVAVDVAASSLDAAFDRQGRLHAIVDRTHLVCDDGVWRASAATPWAGLEGRPPVARFVPDAPDLVWTFPIAGREIGASGRWEIYGFGGYGGGIVWPWFTRGSRAVVVAESPAGFGPWVVIDPEGSMDTHITDATADAAGNVFVSYAASREGMFPATGQYYVKLSADVLAGRDGVEWKRPGEAGRTASLRAAKGTPLGDNIVVRGESAYRPNRVPNPPHFFGGASGGHRMSTNLSQPPRALVVAQARDKWFGRGFPIQYVEFDDVRWSSPVEIGLADHGGSALFGGFVWHAYDLVTTGDGRTFAVWPTAQGIVGRWIGPQR